MWFTGSFAKKWWRFSDRSLPQGSQRPSGFLEGILHEFTPYPRRFVLAGSPIPGPDRCCPFAWSCCGKWNRANRIGQPTGHPTANYGRRTIPAVSRAGQPFAESNSAILGTCQVRFQRWANEAARTVPPREAWRANLTSKSLRAQPRSTSRSMLKRQAFRGDIHFSQGDGEISFCGA